MIKDSTGWGLVIALSMAVLFALPSSASASCATGYIKDVSGDGLNPVQSIITGSGNVYSIPTPAPKPRIRCDPSEL